MVAMNVNQHQLNTKTYTNPSNLSQNSTQINQSPNKLTPSLNKQINQTTFDIRSLAIGQTFQGEVLDIRNGQITINIDHQTLTAKFNNTVNACIGEVLNFIVKETDGMQVVISPLIATDYSSMDFTIDKALEAANLAPTDKNLDIVSFLLKNNMPVDKQTLQSLISTSLRLPNVSAEDLVLMTKYNIAITNENVTQFDHYKNYEHQITKDINELLNLLPDTLSKMVTMQGKEEILRFFSSMFPDTTNQTSITSMISDLFNEYNDPELIKEILTKPEFKDQIAEQLQKQWTIRPEELDAKTLNKTYETLYNHMTLLKENQESNLLQSKEILTTANKIQENLSFIKNLNDTFIYTQLPLQLRNQVTHSDLYVYTDKRKQLNLEQGVSLLLHLDLEHLGTMDISVKLHKNILQSKFSVSEEATELLLLENLGQLESSLKDKGYSATINVEQKQEEHLDFIEDFLDANTSKLDIKRYSFDMRI